MTNIGRNDPCPCGSGKKYKRCCLVESYAEFGFEDFIEKRLVQDLQQFCDTHYKDEVDDVSFFFHEQAPSPDKLSPDIIKQADINFWEWVVFDWVVDKKKKKTLIDLYIESDPKLTDEDLKVLNMMKNSVISLYEVQEVFPEKGLLIKDLLLDEEYNVREKLATRSARKWDVFAARLLFLDKKYIISGCSYLYPLAQKDWIIKDIKNCYRNYKRKSNDPSWKDFLKKNSYMFIDLWYHIIANPTSIILQTTTNEPMIFSKAIFEIKDQSAVLNGLKETKEFENINDGFIWEDLNRYGEKVIFGRIEIKDNQLILECNSRKRLEKGKKIIVDNIGDLVIHKIDSFQDPKELIKSVPPEKKSDIPSEDEKQLYTQFMREYYEKWLNLSVPALGGKTPFQAVKTNSGKMKLIELLKDFENREEHKKRAGKPYFDISWMWKKLDIPHDEN